MFMKKRILALLIALSLMAANIHAIDDMELLGGSALVLAGVGLAFGSTSDGLADSEPVPVILMASGIGIGLVGLLFVFDSLIWDGSLVAAAELKSDPVLSLVTLDLQQDDLFIGLKFKP
jgi:hypothetical protein